MVNNQSQIHGFIRRWELQIHTDTATILAS
jgi:hypothetical protein